MNIYFVSGLCNVTARNGNGSSHCCFFPFKHEGKMAYDCVQDGKTGPYKCPFSRLYETHGICRKLSVFLTLYT